MTPWRGRRWPTSRTRIERQGGHDLWTGPRSTTGRPEVWHHRAYSVRRLRWEQAHGALASGVVLQRKCDEARCVRPEHARAGWPVEQSLAVVLRRQGLVLRAIGALLGADAATVHGWCSMGTPVPTPMVPDGAIWRAEAACRGVCTEAFFESRRCGDGARPQALAPSARGRAR